MTDSESTQLTQLLIQASKGNQNAVDALLPHVYRELKKLAGGYMRREREGHTLNATGLVHEAYMKLVDQNQVEWRNRAHFFGIAASIMRRLLVDHARSRHRDKRGGGVEKVELNEAIAAPMDRGFELIAVDGALDRLTQMDPVQGRVVELRFFGGLSVEECAEVMQISPATVKRHWSVAKAWLYGQLKGAV